MQVGSAQWLRQHDAIERLNIQAHQSAQCRGDEYIVEALVTHDRLSHLVHELLVAEVKRLCECNLTCMPFVHPCWTVAIMCTASGLGITRLYSSGWATSAMWVTSFGGSDARSHGVRRRHGHRRCSHC